MGAVKTGILHPVLGQVQAEAVVVGDDPDEQVAASTALMSRYVREDVGSMEVQRVAAEIAPEGSTVPDVIAGVWDWIKAHVRFVEDKDTLAPLMGQGVIDREQVGDAVAIEAFTRPRDLIVQVDREGEAEGDCDDFAMLTAALLGAHGIESDFATVAAMPGVRDWSHVYVTAYPNGRPLAMDTSHGPFPGWESPSDRRKTHWPAYRPNHAVLVVLALALIVYIGLSGSGRGEE